MNIELSSKDKIKGTIIPHEISPDLAYLCGILAGDGCIYYRKARNDYVIKCVGNPADEQELYYQVIGPIFKKVFGFVPKIKHHDSNTTFGFEIHSKAIFTYLTQIIGLCNGRKEQQLQIPAILRDKHVLSFIRGVFDTDGCVCFKKRYKSYPYYPVISFSSKSKKLTQQIAEILKKKGFKIVETYDYKITDKRIIAGYTIINRIELNGENNLRKWLEIINFSSPKHLRKIKNRWEGNSGERI